MDEHAVPGLRLAREGLVSLLCTRGNDAQDRKVVLGGKLEIALVVAGYGHHRTGAVVHQHEVGDEDRDIRTRERMLGSDSGVEAQLLGGFQLSRSSAALLAQRDEVLRGRVVLRHALRDRVIGGNGNEARPEDRVGTGRVNLHAAAVRQVEAELQALRLADPVLLHRADLLGPFVEIAQTFEQFVGEVGDLEKPLIELALLDQRARAPAAPVNHLLVREHRHVDRVPVDRRFLPGDEAVRIHVEEQRLFVPVVFRLAGGQFTAPVERKAKTLQLRLHVGDVVARPAAGMDALFHGRVLGRHAEGVPAHRVEHFVAAHALVTRQHVAHRVIAHVTDMDATRWIREHLQDVAARLGRGIIRLEALGLVPCRLPADIRLRRVEPLGHFSSGLLQGSQRDPGVFMHGGGREAPN